MAISNYFLVLIDFTENYYPLAKMKVIEELLQKAGLSFGSDFGILTQTQIMKLVPREHSAEMARLIAESLND